MTLELGSGAAEVRLISKEELCRLLGWSQGSIERALRENSDFPKPVRLGKNSIRWRYDEIIRFIMSLPQVDYWGGDYNA